MNATHVVSIGRRTTRVDSPLGAAALILRLAGVTLVAAIGWIHLHLWSHGYRGIPTIGPLFLAAAVSGYVFAAALLVWPSRLFGLAGIGLAIGTLAGLIVSINVGLFGFVDSVSAPYATESAILEIAAALILAGWLALDLRSESRERRRRTR